MDKLTAATVPVVSNTRITPDIYLIKAKADLSVKPGQFCMIKAWGIDPPLYRPLSVYDCTNTSISFLYRICGRGTRLLGNVRPTDELQLLGPLGNGWSDAQGRVALIGGGVGIASLFYTAKVLGSADVYLGYREKPFLVEEFQRVASRVFVSSESGAQGHEGLVTDIITPDKYKACYACGPHGMLVELNNLCRISGIPLFVSLEERMACGVGACLGCTVQTANGPRQACKDGPVFSSEEVFYK